MLPSTVYAARRAELARHMGPRSVAVFRSAPERQRSGDTEYRYRQSSDLHYLTGFAEPGSCLVFRPHAEKERVVLFVRPRDPERETWDGRRAGVEGAVKDFGAEVAYPIEELHKRLGGLVGNHDELHYAFGADAEFDVHMAAALGTMRLYERRSGRVPRRILDPHYTVHEARLKKSPEEIEVLARAAAVTAEAHVAAMRAAKPGVTEFELESIIEHTFRRRGGMGPGYTTIVGAGANATVLHYIENKAALAAGDLVLIDAGCEFDYYTADVTRTFPCGGKFSPAQRRAYDLVLRSQEEAVKMCRPGATIDAIHERVVEILTAGMIELGLLTGEPKDRIADGTYKKYYMHRTSHWLGMDVHDVGCYGDDELKPRPLEAGMVLTIEPGLYVNADDASAPADLRGVGIRIEDDILITTDGHRNLTIDIPKQPAELERICSG